MGAFMVACVLLFYLPDLIEALRDIAAALREAEDDE
jgi:hypothetical protein